jgi:NtrC-family two-component system sensor histidine kinase KinB
VELGSCLILAYAVSALRNAMRMQDQLNAFVVHDLRAPLANIMMALDLVLRTAGKSLDAREKRLVRIATEAGGQMSRLINTLLDLSRLRHHSMPVQPQAVDVGELNDRAAKIMTPWAEDKSVQIVVKPPEEELVGFGDPDVTHRVIVNLLSNAIKYSPKGGKVALSATRAGDGHVAICVTDEGPGIPREWQEKAFDMFAQLEAQRGKAALGSGLGLAFARMAVEAQGGRIWLESGDETGTTVTFTLPKQGPAPAAQPEE